MKTSVCLVVVALYAMSLLPSCALTCTQVSHRAGKKVTVFGLLEEDDGGKPALPLWKMVEPSDQSGKQ